MKTTVLAAAFVLASIVAFADVPDFTSDLEYVAGPNSGRWTERQKMPVCDLFFHDGKLWVGGGATELNAGPCPLQYIDPVTKQVTVERNAGTENITVFKEFSDGRLYVPSQDPRDYDSDYSDDGFVFVRNGADDWTFYKGCAQQQLIDSVSKGTKMGGFVHVWDAEEYGWKFEEWRLNESTGEFAGCEREWSEIAPGVTDEMAGMTVSSDMETDTTQLWHPTKFKDRVLYIFGGHDYNITPWTAFSAKNVNHHVKATRIDLGSIDVRPFDIYPTEDAVYLVAGEASKTTTTVTNSIWKSTDGVNFKKLLWFTSTRQASALCYYDGAFYVGMGANDEIKTGWPKMTGTDVSGNIYRIPYAPDYTAYVTDDLTKPFAATDICIRAQTDGSLGFSIPVADKPSLFVKIVVSSSPDSAVCPE